MMSTSKRVVLTCLLAAYLCDAQSNAPAPAPGSSSAVIDAPADMVLAAERAVSLQSYDINAQQAPEDLQVAVNLDTYYSALQSASDKGVDLTTAGFSTFVNEVLAPGQDNLTDGLDSILLPAAEPSQVTVIILSTPGKSERMPCNDLHCTAASCVSFLAADACINDT
ncbi:hypothetical protein WJX73_004855 [Symbiochloris irregularis]|uniref:Uncharacterized protein n=1 Tax=Symbiochloris irregularis TaxID=706552 RepID=A0AAW1NJF4_9CHLO